jgi:hypothetical protein
MGPSRDKASRRDVARRPRRSVAASGRVPRRRPAMDSKADRVTAARSGLVPLCLLPPWRAAPRRAAPRRACPRQAAPALRRACPRQAAPALRRACPRQAAPALRRVRPWLADVPNQLVVTRPLARPPDVPRRRHAPCRRLRVPAGQGPACPAGPAEPAADRPRPARRARRRQGPPCRTCRNRGAVASRAAASRAAASRAAASRAAASARAASMVGRGRAAARGQGRRGVASVPAPGQVTTPSARRRPGWDRPRPRRLVGRRPPASQGTALAASPGTAQAARSAGRVRRPAVPALVRDVVRPAPAVPAAAMARVRAARVRAAPGPAL